MVSNSPLFGNLFDELPTEWDLVPFPSAVDFQEGPGIMARDFHEDGVPLIRVTNLVNGSVSLQGCNYLDPEKVQQKWNHFRLSPGDLLVSSSGTLGRVAVVGQDQAGIIHYTGIIRMRPADANVDPKFIRYFVSSPFFQQQALALSAGSVLQHFGPSHLKKMTFPVPPLEEQRTIASVLGSLDDKIELNRRMNETLEEMARALFKSWFVDFDPVRARMEGRQPAGMNDETAALFPDSFEDSPLGEIPKGWRTSSLNDIVENARRGVNPIEVSPSTPYIGLDHMPRKSIALSEWGDAEQVASNKFEFRQGEILFGKLRPYFHKVGVAAVDGVCSTDILVVTPRHAIWYGLALGHLSSVELVNHADATSSGTRMPRAKWSDLARFSIAIPSEEIAERFTATIQPFIETIGLNIHQSRTLAAIRDALLPKLLSGEIRVREAEEIVEDAV